MGLFGQLFGGVNSIVDPALGDPRATAVRAKLKKNSFAEAKGVMDIAAHPADRQFYCAALANLQMNVPWPTFEQWTKQHPGDGNAHLLRGVNAIFASWMVRGGAVAAKVSREDAEFHLEFMKVAEGCLTRAAELLPDDPLPHAWIIAAQRALSRDINLSRTHFELANERCDGHLVAHFQMLQRLCTKWGGDNAEMFAFARDQSAGRTDELAMLIPAAHIEGFLLAAMEERPDAENYWKDPAVGPEIIEAYDRSLGGAEYVENRLSLLARNYFAQCFWLLEDDTRTKQELLKIRGRVTEYPWAVAGDPVKAFREVEKAVGAAS